jgi:predicted NodU family carbamoyl transferase
MKDNQLSQIFNKFVGREVFGPFNPVMMPDPTVEEIREEAIKHGFNSVRVKYPDEMMRMTTDYDDKRLNISAVKDADGAYRVTKSFSCG